MSQDVILGIESSCDDTAAAVVDRDGNVLSSIIASQTHIHSHWGGVYPEFASRAHALVGRADDRARAERGKCRRSGFESDRRDARARSDWFVDRRREYGGGLGLGWNVPVLGINHLRGHLRSADLVERRVELPAIVLLVSGGHTFLARMESLTSIELLGSTRDDSVGEAYDKVARLLGLGYPGGPAVDKLAKTGKDSIPFPRPMLNEGFEFSFSGLKSAVGRFLDKNPDVDHADVAASFVSACMEIL